MSRSSTESMAVTEPGERAPIGTPRESGGSRPRILGIITDTPYDLRVRRLLGGLDAEVVYFDVDRSASRWESSRRIRDLLRSQRWDLVFMEGTSIVAGLPLIAAARRRGQRFVVSSGDPIGGFFHATRGPLWGSAFSVYER